MKRTTSLLTSGGVVTSVLLLLAACDGGAGGANGGGGGGGACAEYVNAVAAYFTRCGDGAPETFTHGRDRLEAACSRALNAPGTTNMAAQVTACAQAVSAASCEAASDINCEFTGGTLDDGAACGEHYQCKGGSCETEANTNCGKCAPRVAVGASCTRSSRCVEGAECLVESGESGKCVTVKIANAGESCANEPDEIVECDKGLYCAFGTAEPTCIAPGGAGASCESRAGCQADLKCIDGKCAAGLAEGAECTFDECGAGLGCGTDKKCARIIVAQAGEDCDALRRCARGSCRGVSVTTGADGAPEIKPGKCVDPLPDGADCSENDADEDAVPCDLFAECVAGKCTVVDPGQCK